MRNMQCNVEFWHQLSIFSRNEENNGKPTQGLSYLASARTAQKTPLPKVLLLLRVQLFL
jgi:hypothetical protein